jgi:hypothetical protein
MDEVAFEVPGAAPRLAGYGVPVARCVASDLGTEDVKSVQLRVSYEGGGGVAPSSGLVRVPFRSDSGLMLVGLNRRPRAGAAYSLRVETADGRYWESRPGAFNDLMVEHVIEWGLETGPRPGS